LRQITTRHILEMWKNDLERGANDPHTQHQHLETLIQPAIITSRLPANAMDIWMVYRLQKQSASGNMRSALGRLY